MEGSNKTNKGKLMSKWYWNWFTKNLYLAIVAFVVIVLVLFFLLDIITRHNKVFEVPSFFGLTLEEANKLAKENSLRVEVTDSVYMVRMPLGVVYKQNPIPQSKVKKNRRILLTMNSTTPKMVNMPNLIGLSLRQAQAELASNQLKISKLVYKPDLATNNVLGQIYRGSPISKNAEIPIESEIDLILGINYEDGRTFVPNLSGKPFSVIKDFLVDNSLNLGKAIYDKTVKNYADSLNAVVYRQQPVASDNSTVPLGAPVDVYLTLDTKKVPKSARTQKGGEVEQ